jgi:hypothetical protein
MFGLDSNGLYICVDNRWHVSFVRSSHRVSVVSGCHVGVASALQLRCFSPAASNTILQSPICPPIRYIFRPALMFLCHWHRIVSAAQEVRTHIICSLSIEGHCDHREALESCTPRIPFLSLGQVHYTSNRVQRSSKGSRSKTINKNYANAKRTDTTHTNTKPESQECHALKDATRTMQCR